MESYNSFQLPAWWEFQFGIRVNSGSSRTYTFDNIGIIANFVFPDICTFLIYVHHMTLVNVKLDVSEQ